MPVNRLTFISYVIDVKSFDLNIDFQMDEIYMIDDDIIWVNVARLGIFAILNRSMVEVWSVGKAMVSDRTASMGQEEAETQIATD